MKFGEVRKDREACGRKDVVSGGASIFALRIAT